MDDLANYKDLPAGTLALANRSDWRSARALASRPKLLLLDELMAGLTSTEVTKAIERHRRTQVAARDHRHHDQHVMQAIMKVSEPHRRAGEREEDRRRERTQATANPTVIPSLSRRRLQCLTVQRPQCGLPESPGCSGTSASKSRRRSVPSLWSVPTGREDHALEDHLQMMDLDGTVSVPRKRIDTVRANDIVNWGSPTCGEPQALHRDDDQENLEIRSLCPGVVEGSTRNHQVGLRYLFPRLQERSRTASPDAQRWASSRCRHGTGTHVEAPESSMIVDEPSIGWRRWSYQGGSRYSRLCTRSITILLVKQNVPPDALIAQPRLRAGEWQARSGRPVLHAP